MNLFSAESLVPYLRRQGLIGPDEPAAVTTLGGGISNTVLKVVTTRRRLVVKQALARLRVAATWEADVKRVLQEAACLRVLGERFPGCAPEVMFVDPVANVMVMACAPDGARTWKDDLLVGRIDLAVVQEVGALLGRIHGSTLGDTSIREAFFATAAFHQLRVDPYLLTLIERHPDMGRPLARVVAQMGVYRCALVHGDFSPKNVLVNVNPGGGGLWILDCEPVHYGDPAFDLAFALNHLVLKGFHRPHQAGEYLAAAGAFLAAYRQGTGGVPELTGTDYERRTAALLTALLLARVDGKSPAEYLTDPPTQEAVRRLARWALGSGENRIGMILSEAAKRCTALEEDKQ